MFGSESDSPEAPRALAAALFNNAVDLDSEGEEFSGENLKTHVDKLLGYNGAFTCTAVLSGILKGHLKNRKQNNPMLENIITMTVALSWR